MKQVLIRGGQAVVEEVPAPLVGRKSVLVRVQHSCVSVGTETASLRMSGLPLYRRALKQPENVRRVLAMAREQGIGRTRELAAGKLRAGTPTGYSAAGVVIAVGPEVEAFVPGDRVACGGAGFAHHAEIIDVPLNLVVKIPEELGTEAAATVSLGAIALQGVRRAAPAVGESIAVIGLGVVGQLVVGILAAAGCRVIGSDPNPRRLELARAGGMQAGVNPAEESLAQRVQQLTRGYGADAVIVAASSPGHTVISEALQAARRKGRVVLIGDVGLHLRRSDLYEKELDFLISTSYGPGRYDPSYEEGGVDYPLAYVRWTENRNMEEYVRLLAEGRVSLSHLSPSCYPVDQAREAYRALGAGSEAPLVAILSYPERNQTIARRVTLRPRAADADRIRVAVVGAGGFTQSMHLPNLARLRSEFDLWCVVSRTGSSARAAADRCEATYVTTDFDEVLADPKVDLVLIATRHHMHASMVLKALEAGKHVFVEKPLALQRAELSAIEAFYQGREEGPVLMTGFNRRFSPPVSRALQILRDRTSPLIINYRMNAGQVPLNHWTQTEEGGGRNLGEACHIYDLFNCLTGSPVRAVHAVPIRAQSGVWACNDNFVATISYTDGSVCTLTYTAMGHRSHSKEQMEIYGDGKVITLDDYRSLTIAGGHHRGWSSRSFEKGHLEELKALSRCLRQSDEWPIPLWQQVQATEISLDVEEMLRPQRPL